jgi:hypothetical protein
LLYAVGWLTDSSLHSAYERALELGNMLRGHLEGKSRDPDWTTETYPKNPVNKYQKAASLGTLVAGFDGPKRDSPALYSLAAGNAYDAAKQGTYAWLGKSWWSHYWLDRYFPPVGKRTIECLTLLAVLCVQETSRISPSVDDEIQVLQLRPKGKPMPLGASEIDRYKDKARDIATDWVKTFKEKALT